MRITVTVPDDVGEAVKRRTDNVSAYVSEALEERLRQERRRQALDRLATMVGNFEVSADAYETLHSERRESDRA